jgi:hypothetical protein
MICINFTCRKCGGTECEFLYKLGDAPDFITNDAFHAEIWHVQCKQCGEEDTTTVE